MSHKSALNRKAYLRTLTPGKSFSREELEKEIKKNGLLCNVDYLLMKGQECNWLTRAGRSFKTIAAFANSYNSVFVEDLRKKIFKSMTDEENALHNSFLNAVKNHE